MVQCDSPYYRSTRASSLASCSTPHVEATPPPSDPTAKLPPEYTITPTVPSPFAGRLEASLDAILEFARVHPEAQCLTMPLLARPDPKTNWPALFAAVPADVEDRRELLEELFFLVTRKLLPEQITENRRLMLKMYTAKKTLSARVMLRYDTLREWVKPLGYPTVMDSRAPPVPDLPSASDSCSETPEATFAPPTRRPASPIYNMRFPTRPPLRPNIITTLIAASSVNAYPTRRLADAMKHHATELDRRLLTMDEEVESWGPQRLIVNVASVVLYWQRLRACTETLADMEVSNFEALDGKADENEWVNDSEGFGKHKSKQTDSWE